MAAPALVEKAKARVGSVLREKWKLDGLIGVGGSAAVYAATHRNGKRGAIKLLHPELSKQEELVARFLREGYVANKIDHPGAVSILDDDITDDGMAFLVMELLDGYTLERRLRKRSALPVREALKMTEDLLEVLAAAHEKGIIHRDIKPANIFITKEKVLKVLDFGIARLGAQHQQPVGDTQMGQALGTPAFMPPEQARGRWDDVDVRTDIWAVGATLWALLSGQRPRRAETSNEELLLAMTTPLPLIASVAMHVSPEVAKLVDRAVAFDMAARWPNAKTMQQALRLALLLEQATTPSDFPESAPNTHASDLSAHMQAVLFSGSELDGIDSHTGSSSLSQPPGSLEPRSSYGGGRLSMSRFDALGPRIPRPRSISQSGAPLVPSMTFTPSITLTPSSLLMADAHPTTRQPYTVAQSTRISTSPARPGAEPSRRGRRALMVLGAIALMGVGVGVAHRLNTKRVATPDVKPESRPPPSATTPSSATSATIVPAPPSASGARVVPSAAPSAAPTASTSGAPVPSASPSAVVRPAASGGEVPARSGAMASATPRSFAAPTRSVRPSQSAAPLPTPVEAPASTNNATDGR